MTEDLAQLLQDAADDPMWAAHAEVPKGILRRAAQELRELREHKRSTPLCEQHKPSGGTRGFCVICAGERLHAALSRISYLTGPANEYRTSVYDHTCDEQQVVQAVSAALQEAWQRVAAAWDVSHSLHAAYGRKDPFFRTRTGDMQGHIDAARARAQSIADQTKEGADSGSEHRQGPGDPKPIPERFAWTTGGAVDSTYPRIPEHVRERIARTIPRGVTFTYDPGTGGTAAPEPAGASGDHTEGSTSVGNTEGLHHPGRIGRFGE